MCQQKLAAFKRHPLSFPNISRTFYVLSEKILEPQLFLCIHCWVFHTKSAYKLFRNQTIDTTQHNILVACISTYNLQTACRSLTCVGNWLLSFVVFCYALLPFVLCRKKLHEILHGVSNCGSQLVFIFFKKQIDLQLVRNTHRQVAQRLSLFLNVSCNGNFSIRS